ncbi:class I SAM-dependent methyltransferase [candidate division KSB1 bacterium]|nr:class I SAM-dependent methyltransferase [candidate division KSB1 bacterium]
MIAGNSLFDLYDSDSYLESPYFQALKAGEKRDREPYNAYNNVLKSLDTMTEKKRLLDVGCSYGAFLEMAEEHGWEAYGVEISSKAYSYAVEQRKLNIQNCTLESAEYPDDYFSVVTLWDVVEHLDDPLSTLREIHRVLKADGVLMIFTINQKSLINAVGHLIYALSFKKIVSPLVLLYDIHHNFFFNKRTLEHLLKQAGFDRRLKIAWMDSKIERWQSVPIPPLLSLGTKILDFAARLMGNRYRMIYYAGKGT